MLRVIRFSTIPPRARIEMLLAFCLCLCLVGIGMLTNKVREGLELQATASSDNTQWTFSQLDVEYAYLTAALQQLRQDPTTLPAFRKRFDILFSRATILRQGRLFAPLRIDPLYGDGIAAVSGFLDRWVPLIDGPDDALLAALPRFDAELMGLQGKVKAVVAAGIGAFASFSDQQRHDISRNLLELAVLTGLMITVLFVLMMVLLRLNQSNTDRAEQVRLTLARTESIVTAAIDAVLVIDAKGLALEFNPAAERMFGYSRAEILRRPIGFLFQLDAGGTSPGLLPTTAARPRNRQMAQRRNGDSFPVELSVVEGSGPDGKIFVAYLRDLSDQLANAQALDQARVEAKAGARTKADLLAVMSHEMRTPLNGMMGMIELLGDTRLDPDQRRFLRAMQNSGEILLHHVDDVLTIAKLDSGMQPLQLSEVDLPDLVSEIFANQAAPAAAKGNRLLFQPDAAMPVLIRSDRFQLRQVLLNLVGNAIKFTQSGVITITARSDATTDQHEITVTDTGIGISTENRERVFEDFVTLDASYSRNSGGTGLGLGITRRIVQGLGGTVSAEANPGGGSLFRIRLPRAPADLQPASPALAHPPAPPPDPVGPLRILVAEDNAINRMLLRELLARLGHSVAEAHDGQQVVQMAQDSVYDLIFMDISMPQLDGIAATQMIRNGAGPNRATPIVALTAHTMARDYDRMTAAGMQESLLKPISGRALAALIARLHPAPAKGDLSAQTFAELRSLLGPDRFAATLRSFVQEVEATLQAPGTDRDETLMALHKLGGAAAMLGVADFALVLRKLLDASAEEFADQWQEMLSIWHPTRSAIEEHLARHSG